MIEKHVIFNGYGDSSAGIILDKIMTSGTSSYLYKNDLGIHSDICSSVTDIITDYKLFYEIASIEGQLILLEMEDSDMSVEFYRDVTDEIQEHKETIERLKKEMYT